MLFVFDLDFTLWNCGDTWCDHTSPPYRKQNGVVHDTVDRKIRLYPEVFPILENLNRNQVQIGVASRTYAPDWADELMRLFEIKKYIHHFEIYPGSKLSHFRELHKKTKIPFNQMIFFDDEQRNIDEVAQLGVKVIHVKNGLNSNLIQPYINWPVL